MNNNYLISALAILGLFTLIVIPAIIAIYIRNRQCRKCPMKRECHNLHKEKGYSICDIYDAFNPTKHF